LFKFLYSFYLVTNYIENIVILLNHNVTGTAVSQLTSSSQLILSKLQNSSDYIEGLWVQAMVLKPVLANTFLFSFRHAHIRSDLLILFLENIALLNIT